MTIALISSSGGHLDEALELVDRFVPVDAPRVWLTPECHQATSLLAGLQRYPAPPVGSRQAWRALKSVRNAVRFYGQHRISLVISTGAALSVPYLVVARARQIPVIFIDSATRLEGPSLTGGIVRWMSGVVLMSQTTGWGRPWRTTESVFANYRAEPRPEPVDPRRILVTLGTERFPCPRVLETTHSVLSAEQSVVWQLGHTPAPSAGLPGRVEQWIPFEEMSALASASDVTITHAGVGTLLLLMRLGKFPVVFARDPSRGEHVDSHQVELAHDLADRGLIGLAHDAKTLRTAIEHAAATRIVRV